jgi:hypothetical protein
MRIETVGSMISVWETPLWGMSIEMAPGTDASRHPRQEVAHLAGVDAAYVDLLIDLEILKPDHLDLLSAGDVRRVRWIRSFERSGVPLEGISSAVRRGALSFAYLDMSAFDWFARLTSKTFEQSSVSSGIPFELLAVVRETFGHPEPEPNDHVREDELTVIDAIEALLSEGYRPSTVEGLLRVYGDSLRRIVEAETQAYRAEIEVPMLESGMTEREMLEAQAQVGSDLTHRCLPSASSICPATPDSPKRPGTRRRRLWLRSSERWCAGRQWPTEGSQSNGSETVSCRSIRSQVRHPWPPCQWSTASRSVHSLPLASA